MIQGNEQNSTLRYGEITAYDPARHMARVNFPDLGIISHWLPILTSNTQNTHFEHPLDSGEHVACIMAGTGTESGVILGAFHDDKNTPLVADKDTHAITFEDGTRITYSRSTHALKVECVGDIEIHAEGNIKLTAARIDLN